MTNLLDLPAEILTQICEQLCYHCRNPRHFVNADEEESIEDKRALAKLCRTSRTLLNLEQPLWQEGSLDAGCSNNGDDDNDGDYGNDGEYDNDGDYDGDCDG
ncbi:hypothetical protein K456DRAFT_1739950 [Colletotrichum gloeosporioides 23]|nr:hypothetical protein K456DRAFT_1739950 [Colletotrichum gloeosporioides 23]